VTVVDAQLAFIDPFNVAPVMVIAVAGNVTAAGTLGKVVKVRSFPLAVPPAFTPFTL
jgi:hypothetical protein